MHNSESPRTDDAGLEPRLQAISTAPRVTLAALEANVKDVEYVKHVSKSGQILRWAVITTLNGFAVTGDPSASVSPDNDDQQIGEQVAYDNAKSKLWQFMGYALKEQLDQVARQAAANKGA
jgi:hypothetical protein